MTDIYTPRETSPLRHARRQQCPVDYWATDVIKDPPEGYEGRHRDDRPAPLMGEVYWSKRYGMFRRVDTESDFL